MTASTQLVPDPEFDYPSAWTFSGFGASVTGGQLGLVNPTLASSTTVPPIVPEIGKAYPYKYILSAAIGSFLYARIWFGGVLIYNNSMVLGTHSGTVTPIAATGLIFQAQGAGQRIFDRIVIGREKVKPNWDANALARHKKYHEQQQLEQHRKQEKIIKDLIHEERIIRYL